MEETDFLLSDKFKEFVGKVNFWSDTKKKLASDYYLQASLAQRKYQEDMQRVAEEVAKAKDEWDSWKREVSLNVGDG